MSITEPIRQSAAGKGPIHRVADGRYAKRDTEGGPVAYEQGTAIRLRTSVPQVAGKRLPRLHRQGQVLHALALGPVERHDPVAPIHGIQRQMRGLVAPQAQIEQAAGDGMVAQTDRISQIEGVQEVLNLAIREDLRRMPTWPVCDGRQRRGQ